MLQDAVICPPSCRPTLKITKLYDMAMLIFVRKRLISVFLSGESDIRNGIYGRPTTQHFDRNLTWASDYKHINR